MPPSAQRAPRSRAILGAGSLLLVLCAILSVVAIAPPAVRSAQAPPSEFSAERALDHLRVLAREPRPPGSAAHDRARDYLVRVLGEMGLEVEVQRAAVSARLAGSICGADVENVVARLPGTARVAAGERDEPGAHAILLAAHYDAVPHSPGASDDGAAVAALLETARALRAGPALRNDVIVLLSDAEELGLLGAIGFAEQHRWRAQIGVALNFEARGSRGAVAMYQTSPGSEPLVRALGEAVSHPVSSSLVGVLAQALPNDTDATVFIRAGYPTYAFAYAEGVTNYHRFSDSLASLDPRSLQHHGDYALALARHLGTLELGALRSGSPAVYFDLFGCVLVRYSLLSARALALLELLLLGVLLWRAARHAWVSARGIALGAALALAGIVVLPLGVTASQLLLTTLVGPQLLVERASILAWHYLPLAGALLLALWHRALRRRGMVECGVGALAVVAVLAIALGLFVPGASYPLAWPVLFALLGAAVWLRAPSDDDRWVDLAVSVPLVPAAVLAASVSYTVFVLQGAFTPGVVAAFVAVIAPLAVPLLGRLVAAERRALGGVLLLTALGGVVAGLWPAAPRPSTDSLVYALDLESGDARWLTEDRFSDAFVAQRVPPSASATALFAFSPYDEWRRTAPAALVLLDAPAFALAPAGEPARAPGERVALRVRPPAAASCLSLWDDEGTAVISATLDGRPVTDLSRFSPELDEKLMSLATGSHAHAHWRLRYCGLRGRELGLELALAPGARLRLRAVSELEGLPGPTLAPRPPGLHPSIDSDVTLVSRLIAQ